MKRYKLTYVTGLLVLAGLKSNAQVTDWVSTNWPSIPYVQDITVDSLGFVFAATFVDGVYRSTDNGNGWTNLAFPDSDVKFPWFGGQRVKLLSC